MAPLIIAHGAPTLARLKTASLFRAAVSREQAAAWHAALCPKGVSLIVLQQQGAHLLLYLYRPAMLQADLKKPGVAAFLARFGYTDLTLPACLDWLQARLAENAFPHEIGLFLGYPLADVEGFIGHAGRDCKCVGYWKVYGDEQEALRQFAKFDKCTRVYQECFQRGRSILKLTVPA